MNNTAYCQGVWRDLINAAKLRLFDAKDKQERSEWRRSLRTLEALRKRNVQLPTATRRRAAKQ
jgi:hypothetical protein